MSNNDEDMKGNEKFTMLEAAHGNEHIKEVYNQIINFQKNFKFIKLFCLVQEQEGIIEKKVILI